MMCTTGSKTFVVNCSKRAGCLVVFVSLCATPALAQTTDGLISGRVTDSGRGTRGEGANVFCSSSNTNASGAAGTDASGEYVLPLLSPGIYRVRVEAAGFQAKEIQELEVPVSGRLGLDFELRPLADVWETGMYRTLLLPGSKATATFSPPHLDQNPPAPTTPHPPLPAP